METELPATPSQFSLSISLYILFQGTMPLFWSAISEVKGRKASHVELQVVDCLLKLLNILMIQLVYLGSLSLFTIGSIVVALSHNVEL
jgi:MFS family permease